VLERVNRFFFFSRWLSYIADKPVFALLAILIFTILIGAKIPWLTFSTSMRNLIVDDVPERVRYEEFKALFGTDEIIHVVIKGDGVFSPPFFEQLQTLSRTFGQIPGVKRVLSLSQVKKSVDPRDHWSLERFEELVEPVKIFQRYFISPDHRVAGITLIPDEQADQEAISRMVNISLTGLAKGYQGYQIGMPSVSIALSKDTQRDFFHLPFYTILIIAVFLLVLFRSFVEMVIPLLTVAVAVIWTMGVVAWIGLTMNMLTVVVPVLMIAVGTAYCLYIYCAFRYCIPESDDVRSALLTTYSRTAYPTVIAVVTTISGIISLMVTPISAIRQFSGLACLGIIALLVAVLFFLPCLLVIAWPNLSKRQLQMSDRFFSSTTVDKLVHLIVDHRRKIFLLLIIVSFFLLAGIFRIHVETNPLSYFKRSTPVHQQFHDIYSHLSGSFPLHLQLSAEEEDYFLTTSAIATLKDHQRFLETLPGVDKTLSFADYLMLVNYVTNNFDAGYYKLPDADYEVRMLANQFKTILGRDILSRYIGKDFATANITMLTRLHSSKGFLETEKMIQGYCKQHRGEKIACHTTGFGLVMSLGCKHLVNGQIYSLLITLGIIFVLIHIMFLSIKIGAIAMLTNLFPIMVSFGAMGWLGIDLSMGTCLIASIVLGLAVDDTVHYLVQYKRAYAVEMDSTAAMRRTLMYIGRPIVATGIAISAGFSILIFSSFTPTAVFGLLMMLAMASSLSGGLIILPALLSKVSPITLEEIFELRIGGVELQQKVPLLRGMTRYQVHRILKTGIIRNVKTGAYLFEQDDFADSMYIVISGVFDAFMIDPDVNSERRKCLPTRVNRLGVGEVIGEMGMMTSGSRCASVVAVTSGEVLELNQTHLERIRLVYPRTAGRFFANLSTILTEKLIKADRLLSQACSLDDDTGMLNREAFLSCLDIEIRRALRFNDPIALCLLEFDVQGHELQKKPLEMERIFCEVADMVSDNFRKIDTIGRLDKSEIAVILVRADTAFADELISRLKYKLTSQKMLDNEIKTSIAYQCLDLSCLLSEKNTEILSNPVEVIHFVKQQAGRYSLY
jgi:predicted RND superfamily exporter protein/CRP-like cAMP-binding protein